jgi:hypothetical protein
LGLIKELILGRLSLNHLLFAVGSLNAASHSLVIRNAYLRRAQAPSRKNVTKNVTVVKNKRDIN